MNQRGSTSLPSLPVVLAIVLGLGLGASVYLNYVQHTRATNDRKLLQGEITDLRYQVNQDKLASTATAPTPSPLATPETVATPTPSPTPGVAGTASVSISQYAVKVTVADPVADLTYNMVTNGAYQVAGLTTRALIAKYPACSPSNTNNALGQIVQKKAGVKSSGVLIKQAGTFSYYYITPVGFCATDQPGRDALAADRAAIKNAVLPTLTN